MNVSGKSLFPCHTSAICDDEVMLIYTWLLYSTLCQVINIFGTVTNIINIICFIKQGFKDSVNVSLVGLSISDLGCLTTLIITNVSNCPLFTGADLPFDPMEVNYLVAGLPHLSFCRVSSCITAIIILERCMCIIAPLKIKSIITPKRAFITIVCVFVVLLFEATPLYIVLNLDMKFSVPRNKTILGLVYKDGHEIVQKLTYTITNFSIPMVAFVIIIVCTITLVIKLRNATNWSKKSINPTQADRISGRNRKIARMTSMISSLFIISYTPISTAMLALAYEPELSFGGKYMNTGIILGGIIILLESINASMNIFIYYHMSSRYRDVFEAIFCKKKNKLQHVSSVNLKCAKSSWRTNE